MPAGFMVLFMHKTGLITTVTTADADKKTGVRSTIKNSNTRFIY